MKGSKEGRKDESKKKTTRDKIQSIVVCCGVQMRKLATFRRIKMLTFWLSFSQLSQLSSFERGSH